MKTIILVDNGERKVLMEQFKCSYPTVRTALKGKGKTALAYRIRKAAIEHGGVEVDKLDNDKIK